MSKELSELLLGELGARAIPHPLARNHFLFIDEGAGETGVTGFGRVVSIGTPTITFEISDWNRGVRLKSMHTLQAKQGNANRFLEAFTAAADKQGIKLNLSAVPFGELEGKLNVSQLKKLYKKFGFIFDGEEGVRNPARLVIRSSKEITIKIAAEEDKHGE